MYQQRKPEPETKNFVVHGLPLDLGYRLLAAKAKIRARTYIDFLDKVVTYIEKHPEAFLEE